MRLGIFLPSWIGDTCMATPALRAIRAGIPDTQIFGIAKSGPAALLAGSHLIDDWIKFPTRGGAIGKRLTLVQDIRRQNLDAVLLLTNSLSSAMIAWLAKVPARIGYATDSRGLLLTKKVGKPCLAAGFASPSLIESYLNLAAAMQVDASDRRMQLETNPAESDRVEKIFKVIGFDAHRPLIVINNSAASAKSRVWPSQYVVHLARQLAWGMKAQVLLHCGPNDRAEANSIAQQVNNPLVQSMGEWHDLPLSLSIAVLSKADVVVSTDSGPRHMAAALNRPVVSLFGSTEPQRTRTFNIEETVLESFQECRPCYKSECPLKHHHCMRQIEVDTVRTAIENSLRSGLQSRMAA